MKRLFLIVLACLAATAASAQSDDNAFLDIGNDAFRAGNSVSFTGDGAQDLFAAGQRVTVGSDITGSAHLAGRTVEASGAIGGNIYAMGMNVDVTGAVAGNATLTGYSVQVGAVSGDLRGAGSEVTVTGPVGGYALLSGETVRVEGAIAGDVRIAANTVEFGPDASIDGKLTLYEEKPDSIDVPESVIAEDRIERIAWDGSRAPGDVRGWTFKAVLGALWSFVATVLFVAALAALAAALFPEWLAATRRRILSRPLGTLGLGFLLMSTILGSSIMLALTVIGIFITPAVLVLGGLVVLAGYLLGTYALGVGVMMAVGRPEPDRVLERALAGGLGAIIAGLLALIPLLGWLFVLALTLAGAGAMAWRTLAPRLAAPS